MNRKALTAAVFAAVAMLGLSASARAAGGIIEINQAVVNAAGGFPYQINGQGSYRLSGNLTDTSSANAIEVNASNVTIDLNGFTILHAPSGSNTGVSAGAVFQVKVENGMVSGFSTGVSVGNNSIVRDVLANFNSIGILAAASSTVEGCTANSNSNFGIVVGTNSLVEGCTANSNTIDGIECNGNSCAISGNTANSNTSFGIQCTGNNCAISGNTANSNSSDGIACGSDGCAISGNTANSNSSFGIYCGGNGCAISGNTTTSNSKYGIVINSSAGLILHNAVYGSGEAGIFSNDSTTAYGENVLDNNTGGPVSGPTSLKNNLCSGTIC